MNTAIEQSRPLSMKNCVGVYLGVQDHISCVAFHLARHPENKVNFVISKVINMLRTNSPKSIKFWVKFHQKFLYLTVADMGFTLYISVAEQNYKGELLFSCIIISASIYHSLN